MQTSLPGQRPERPAPHPPETIELEGLRLRRVRIEDADLVAASVAANLDWLAAWMPWATTGSATPQFQRQRTPEVVSNWQQGSAYEYLAIDPQTGAHLGSFGLQRRIGPQAIEIGYWLTEAAAGHGHATAAARALTDAALLLPDVDRVEIHCDEANVRSQLIPQRLGFRLDRVEPVEISTPSEVGRSMIWVTP